MSWASVKDVPRRPRKEDIVIKHSQAGDGTGDLHEHKFCSLPRIRIYRSSLGKLCIGPRSGVDIPCGVDFMGNRNRVLFLTGLLSQSARACSTEPNGEISTMIKEAYKQL